MGPEITARPLGIILPTDRERELLASLTPRQSCYVAHFIRSNPKTWTVEKAVRKAKEQRP